MTRVAILGATGSIGRQTLQVIQHCGLHAVALGCYGNEALLRRLGAEYGVEQLVCIAPVDSDRINYVGPDAYERYAQNGDYDILVVACASMAGLRPTVAALLRGKRVALANKETLVVGAHLVHSALEKGGELLPIDSEHCAIHQCWPIDSAQVCKILLTASGGAVRDMPIDQLYDVTKQQVLAHPNWSMGDKITVDCATLVNKGFEVLEAMALFGVSIDKVQAVLHRESIVHSIVQYIDNAYLAQMGVGDMRMAIQYALTYPQRLPSLSAALDWQFNLSFAPIDDKRYPCYSLVRSVADNMAKRTALVAADDVAVHAFLQGHIPFGKIHTILQQTVAAFDGKVETLDAVDECYRDAARLAKECL